MSVAGAAAAIMTISDCVGCAGERAENDGVIKKSSPRENSSGGGRKSRFYVLEGGGSRGARRAEGQLKPNLVTRVGGSCSKLLVGCADRKERICARQESSSEGGSKKKVRSVPGECRIGKVLGLRVQYRRLESSAVGVENSTLASF